MTIDTICKKNKKKHSYNKPVELTYHKAGMLIQYPRTYKTKKVTSINVSGSKGRKRNFHDAWKSKFVAHFLSIMIPVTTFNYVVTM